MLKHACAASPSPGAHGIPGEVVQLKEAENAKPTSSFRAVLCFWKSEPDKNWRQHHIPIHPSKRKHHADLQSSHDLPPLHRERVCEEWLGGKCYEQAGISTKRGTLPVAFNTIKYRSDLSSFTFPDERLARPSCK